MLNSDGSISSVFFGKMLVRHRSWLKFPAFVALIRSLSSYAAAEWVAMGSNVRTGGNVPDASVYNIRLAKRSDITAIRDCNLRNLPENYSDDFFKRHLNTWPALSIVAVKDDELIGYALGRSEVSREKVVSTEGDKQLRYVFPSVRYNGHVTSLAVHPPFRGLGVAKSLMQSLHTQMLAVHSISEVSLHCRVSNLAAIKLYSEFFSYTCASRVPHYYEDAEDAWMMKSDLTPEITQEEEGKFASPFLMPNSRQQKIN